MASKASAMLGGKPLVLQGESVIWPLRAGVLPTLQSFNMAPADALAISGTSKPVTLEITPDQGTPLKVTNLWILTILPGENAYISKVVVADRRWFWDRVWVKGDYNCRRNVGVKRLVANDQELLVDFDRAPDIAYWRWSLVNGTTKFQSLTMLKDILSKTSQAEKNYWGQTFESVLDDRLGQKIQGLSIEELRINDKGHEAVNRAVSYLPEAAITVDYDGKVIVFSRAGGDDIQLVKALMPEIWGKGHVDLVKNSSVRPKQIDILFTREVEVRFDFLEVASATTGTQTTTDEPLGVKRQMLNVVSNPDYATDGTSGRPSKINGRILPQGAWVNIDDYMRALPVYSIDGVTYRIDHSLLQRAFIPQMDLWAAWGLAGDLPDGNGNLQPWPARIAEFQLRYRRTFELNRLWTDRFHSFRAYRISTIDPQTGQRGPSLAYGDYCLLPSQRGRFRNLAKGKPLYFGINKTGYPTGASAVLDSTAINSPAIVSVLDMDQGIVHVDYAMDLNRTYEMVLPSQVQIGSMPTADITAPNRPIAFNEIVDANNPPRLSPSFKLALIVTAVPASPNSAQQYHRITVKPSDIKNLLPDSQTVGLDDANGPIMEEYVGPGTEVARIRWSDVDAQTIEHIFGLDTNSGGDFQIPNDPASQEAFSKQVSKLCINEGKTGGKAGASLNEIAKARAASIYASFVDRYEGKMTGYMNAGIHLNGWANEITHEYTTKAETFTTISFPSAIPQMSLFGFLSNSERAVILHLAQP